MTTTFPDHDHNLREDAPRPRLRVRRLIAALAAAIGVASVFSLGTGIAVADTPYQSCGYSDDYANAINTMVDDEGVTHIQIDPTGLTRVQGVQDVINGRVITNDLWHAVQACVPNLYDGTADAVYQQINCHVVAAATPNRDGEYYSGPTFDIETNHDPLVTPDLLSYFDTKCLDDDSAVYGHDVRYLSPAPDASNIA